MTNGERIIEHFKRCCKLAKKYSGSKLSLRRVQHLAAVRYGFKSFAELKSKPFHLIMQFDTRLDVPNIMEVIANA